MNNAVNVEKLHRMHLLKAAILFLPPMGIIHVLWAPIPYSGVEFAGYFESLSFVRDGLESYTYLIPSESTASIHLHALIASPLVALGFEQGGRLISLLAVIGTVAAVIHLGTHWYGQRAGLLAGALLWAHPLTMRFASTWYTQGLSMFLTTVAIVVAVHDKENPSLRRYASVLGLLIAGIATHRWEVIIAFPLAVIYFRDNLYKVIGVALTGIGMVAFVEWVKSLQSIGSVAGGFSVFSNPDSLLSLNMISGWGTLEPGVNLGFFIGYIIPLTAISLVVIGYMWHRERQSYHVYHVSWFASGLSIPVLLPLGYQLHFYYVWGLLVPLALAGGLIISRTIDVVDSHGILQKNISTKSCLVSLIVISLVISSLGLGTFPAAIYIDGEPVKTGELQEAGREVESLGVTNSSDITFVGPWGYDGSCQYWNCHNGITRVVIYADLLPKQRTMRPSEPETPNFANETQDVSDCVAMVIYNRSNQSARVQPC